MLAVLGVAVLCVGLVVKAVVPAVAAAASGKGDPQPVVTTPAPTRTVGPVGPCTAADLSVSVSPRSTTVAWGAPVALATSVRKLDGGPCVVDTSDRSRVVSVVPVGKDGTPGAAVWSSRACTVDPRSLLLGAGDVDDRTVTWHRQTGACGSKKLAAPGDYAVTVSLLGVTSDPVPFTLLPEVAPTTKPTTGPTAPATTAPTIAPTTAPSGAAVKPTTAATTKAPGKPSGTKPTIRPTAKPTDSPAKD